MFRHHSCTEAGGHAVNEDAFLVAAHPDDADCLLCFLADGMGGQAHGGPAARLACRAGMEVACAYGPERLTEADTWASLFRGVDRAVAADEGAGYTTFVGLCVRGERVAGVSCGDSMALVLQEGRVTVLTARQVKNPPLGSGVAVGIPFVASLEPAGRLLVMSDGVWKYVGLERVIERASRERAEELPGSLRRSASLPGSGGLQDDFTVVVVEWLHSRMSAD